MELFSRVKFPNLVQQAAFLTSFINEYLEENYPTPSLMPKDPPLRSKIRKIVSQAKEELKLLLRRSEDEIEDRPYLAGDFSLLDAAVIPRFLRIEDWGPPGRPFNAPAQPMA
jgi:glutathione S-transferase